MSETKRLKASEVARVAEIIERYKGFREKIVVFASIHGGRGARLVYKDLQDEYVFSSMSFDVRNFLSEHLVGLEHQASCLRKEIEDAGFECDI